MFKYLMSGILVCLTLQIHAQTTPTPSKQDSLAQKLAKELADMQQKYLALNDLNKKVDDKLNELNKNVENGNSRTNNIENKVKSVENLSENTHSRLNQLSVDDVKTKENLHKNNFQSFFFTAEFIDQVNSTIITFDATTSQMSYFNSIADLNNPQSGALGFKLDEVVANLIRDKLMTKAKDKNAFNKAIEFTKTMINAPLVQNSSVGNVIRTITSTVPGVNTLTSVFGLVANLVISDRGLKAEDLKAFSDELKKYITHYEALAKVNQELEYSLNNLKIKTASLRSLATNFARENAVDLYRNDGAYNVNDLNKMELTELLDKYFSSRLVENYFKKQEIFHKKEYKKLTEVMAFSSVGRTKVSFIRDELEKIYSEQLTTYQSYQQNILAILKNASGISNKKEDVENTITRLTKNFEEMIANYQKQVKLDRVRATANEVPRY